MEFLTDVGVQITAVGVVALGAVTGRKALARWRAWRRPEPFGVVVDPPRQQRLSERIHLIDY